MPIFTHTQNRGRHRDAKRQTLPLPPINYAHLLSETQFFVIKQIYINGSSGATDSPTKSTDDLKQTKRNGRGKGLFDESSTHEREKHSEISTTLMEPTLHTHLVKRSQLRDTSTEVPRTEKDAKQLI
jgi:hypothetical protein